jgi:hypothetical protein
MVLKPRAPAYRQAGIPVGRDGHLPVKASAEKLFLFQDEINEQFIGQMVEVLSQTLF